MAEKCESGSMFFSSTVTINGCTIKGVALETNHEPTHRTHITLPWGEKKSYVGMTPGSCSFYYTDGHAILCKVCLDKVERYTCYYTVCRTVDVCSQNIRVKDKDTGVGIANATVAARPSVGSIIRCTTDSNGRCSLTNLIEGDSYRLVVEGIPLGYKCQYTADCETTITACEGEKTFRLKEEALTCEQKIKVIDEGGSLIDASVSVSGATCAHISKGKYKITLSTGDSLKAKATKSGYTDATYNFTACRSEITLTLRKEVAPPEYCYQYVRVETSDGKSVTYEITWGPGTWAMGTTPDTSMLYCEKGKSYTATATASGYKSASKAFTACTSQFTLILTKEVAPACDTYTTKSSCEAAGCFWYNNACHEYGPVKCSDYTDALTCVANNCYWWSDGTCHDTEEAPPISAYEECGRAPTSSDSKTYITDWWKCACVVAEKKGVCHSSWASWFNEVYEDIKVDLGVEPHMQGVTQNPDGDYIKIWMGHYPEIYLGRFKWKCAPVVGKFIINVPKGIFGPIGKGVVMVYKVHKLPFIDAYVGLGLPAKNFWCETPPCTFEVVGLEKRGKYAIFPSSSISVLPYVTSKCVYEFTDKVQTIDLPVYIDPLSTVLCDFFELTPSECAVFLMEFQDPIYVANTLSVIRDHEDIMGNPRDPETLDYVMLPIVMVGSLLPVVPMGKISQWTGRGLKLAKKSAASKTFLIKHHQKIHHLTAVGDEARILKFKAFFDADKLDDALKILNEGVTSSEATEAVKALKRANLRKWIRGIIAKWKKDNPKTTIQKLMDDTAEHGGNVFKTQADVIVKHVDDAGGDWTKIRKIWGDTVKTADDVVYVDLHLAGKSPEFQRMHNLMRYTKGEYIKALKAEKAFVPGLGTRFDEGIVFLCGKYDETGKVVKTGHFTGESDLYLDVFKGLSDGDVGVIIKNLDDVGEHAAALRCKNMKEASKSVVAKKGVTDVTDIAADTARGATKKEAGGIVDDYIDMLQKIKETVGEAAARDAAAKSVSEMVKKMGRTAGRAPTSRPGHFGWYFENMRWLWDKFSSRPWKVAMSAFGVFSAYLLFTMVMDITLWGPGTAFHHWPTERVAGIEKLKNEIYWDIENDLLGDVGKGTGIEAARAMALAGRKGEALAIFKSIKYDKYPKIKKKLGGPDMPDHGPKCGGAFTDIENCPKFIYECFTLYWKIKCNEGDMYYPMKYIGPFPLLGPLAGIGGMPTVPRLEGAYQDFMDKWVELRADADDAIENLPTTLHELDTWMGLYGYVETAPPAPPNFYCTNPTENSVELHWSLATPHPDYPASIVNYEISMNGDILTKVGATVNTYKVTGLKSNTEYYFQIQTIDAYNLKSAPRTDTCTTKGLCPSPSARFTATTTNPKVGESIDFDPSGSHPGTGASYKTNGLIWDFGDGSTQTESTEKKVSHSYSAKGVYHVNLEVTNDCDESRDATPVVITVEVATGNIKCYCTPTEYCKRNADIFVDGNKVDVTKESGYTYIKDQTPGVHTVKYNLLDVMECSGYVTVTADNDVDFSCQLKSKLPASQTAKVTAIVDGDGIKTDKTGDHEIRIIGYDAFECRIYPSDCTLMGKYGYEKLKSIIPVGTSVTLKIDQWLPLGFYNRVIADIFVGTKDIAAEMLKSCLVRFPEKTYRDKYYWDPWAEYARIWCDPEKVIPPDEYKPKIVEIETAKKTFKIKNNWLALWFLPEFVDSGGTILGKATERKIEVGKTSTAITYFGGTYAIKLYARVDTKDDWTLVDTGYVAAAPPTKKTVTFKSVPSGASVRVVKKESARLVRALKRVRSKKVINV